MNAFRHAPGAGVTVGCHVEAGRLRVDIADDGPGFDPDLRSDSVSGSGMGLAGMRERVESIGGEFRIRAVPGAGVRLSISLPLEEMR